MLTVLFQNIINSKYYYQPSWVMLVIVLSVMILGYLYSAFHSRFNAFIKAVFISRFLVLASREERSLSHPVSLLLSLNFILVMSLFILQLIFSETFFHSEIVFSFTSFILLSLIILAVYSVKILFLRTTGFITDKYEMIAEYIFTIFLLTQFLGIALLPVVIFVAYGPPAYLVHSIYVGCALMFLAFIVRIGKGIGASLTNREATMFYIILYLCTFEILPLLIGLKLIEKLVR